MWKEAGMVQFEVPLHCCLGGTEGNYEAQQPGQSVSLLGFKSGSSQIRSLRTLPLESSRSVRHATYPAHTIFLHFITLYLNYYLLKSANYGSSACNVTHPRNLFSGVHLRGYHIASLCKAQGPTNPSQHFFYANRPPTIRLEIRLIRENSTAREYASVLPRVA